MKIRLSGIYKNSIVDGPGIRYAIYTQGCQHQCPGCHNPGTHDIQGGYFNETTDVINDVLKYPLIKGITISGGEPFLQIEAVLEITNTFYGHKDIMIYTGFDYDFLLEKAKRDEKLDQLLHTVDYIVDGKFIQALRDLSLTYRGSSNQRIIDVKQTRIKKEIILKEF